MDKRTREGKLYAAAIEQWFEGQRDPRIVPSFQSQKILECVAVMLAEATKPKQTKEKKDKGPTQKQQDYVLGEAVWKKLKAEAPDAIIYHPPQKHTFSALGKKLREAEVTQGDLDSLALWLASGGLDWMDNKCHWLTFLKYSLDWIGRARTDSKLKTYEELGAIDKLREELGGL